MHEIETRLGAKVLQTVVDGAHGGGAQLTPAARNAIAQFRAFEQGLDTEVERRYARAYLSKSRR